MSPSLSPFPVKDGRAGVLGRRIWGLAGAAGVVTAILLPVVAGACGDGVSTVSPTATATTGIAEPQATVLRSPPAPFSIRNAPALRDALLELAGTANWDVSKVTEGYGAFEPWRKQYPALRIFTPASPADQLRISVYVDPLFSDRAPSASNPYLVAFAAADSGGRCAAGSILGFPAPSQYGQVEIGNGPCTGDHVAAVVRDLALGR